MYTAIPSKIPSTQLAIDDDITYIAIINSRPINSVQSDQGKGVTLLILTLVNTAWYFRTTQGRIEDLEILSAATC